MCQTDSICLYSRQYITAKPHIKHMKGCICFFTVDKFNHEATCKNTQKDAIF